MNTEKPESEKSLPSHENKSNAATERKGSSEHKKRIFQRIIRGNEQELFEEDINYIFNEDREKFIGEFISEDTKVIRGFIDGKGKQVRLYYTKMQPVESRPIASVCIVHGFGEHSSRFLDV